MPPAASGAPSQWPSPHAWRNPSATRKLPPRSACYASHAVVRLGCLPLYPQKRTDAGGRSRRNPKRRRGLLRLDVELLPESAPLLLLSADDLRGTLRRTAAVCRQTKRQEPLLDIGAAEVEIDLVIELRDHFRWCACWRDNRKKTIHD